MDGSAYTDTYYVVAHRPFWTTVGLVLLLGGVLWWGILRVSRQRFRWAGRLTAGMVLVGLPLLASQDLAPTAWLLDPAHFTMLHQFTMVGALLLSVALLATLVATAAALRLRLRRGG